jgi:hypothetical protein
VTARAQAGADQAYEAYQRGEYPQAIALYLDSYRLVPTADALFNIASIYDKKLHDVQLAAEFYRRCAASPDASSDLVERSTSRLAALSSPPSPLAAPPVVAPMRPTSSGSDPGSAMRTVGLIAGAIGVAGIGTGTAFGLMAQSQHSRATSAGCGNGSCPTQAAAATEEDAATKANISTVAFAVGGAVFVGGVLLYLLAPRRADEPAVTAAPIVGPGALGVAISGTTF